MSQDIREFESHTFRQMLLQINRLGGFFVCTHQTPYPNKRGLKCAKFRPAKLENQLPEHLAGHKCR